MAIYTKDISPRMSVVVGVSVFVVTWLSGRDDAFLCGFVAATLVAFADVYDWLRRLSDDHNAYQGVPRVPYEDGP